MGGGVFDLFKIPFYWMFWNEIVFAETSGNYASIFVDVDAARVWTMARVWHNFNVILIFTLTPLLRNAETPFLRHLSRTCSPCETIFLPPRADQLYAFSLDRGTRVWHCPSA